jgi:hypothetical protein
LYKKSFFRLRDRSKYLFTFMKECRAVIVIDA